jgi:septal ring factor EnvC (AmiA/AmiB activator)
MQVITILNQEMAEMDKEIENNKAQILVLQKELTEKQANYAKSANSMYRRGHTQDKLLFILSADNFSQSMRRIRYLREYSEWQKRQAEEITGKQAEISLKQKDLEKKRAEKNQLIGVRETEQNKLKAEEASKKEEAQQLDKKQKELQADLKKKQAQAAALNRKIEQQIAYEIAQAEEKAKKERAEREARNKNKNKTDKTPQPEKSEERVAESKGGYAMTKAERALSSDFATNKGRLPYPVKGSFTVVGEFGEQQHQELKYVRTNNSGIDIQTAPGSDARSVFNGEVTRVFVVPGYNNSVIIRHGNYLTVYSNLSDVYVKAGDKVTTRQPIGKIYTDTEDGNSTILHFQLWKEKTKLNPSSWLSR